MNSRFALVFYIILSFLLSACASNTEASIDGDSEAADTSLEYPGPEEANEVLHLWEQAIRNRDENLFKKLMHNPEIVYENAIGEEIVFSNIENALVFRFDYFKDLGPTENYLLPYKAGDFNDEWGYFYRFEHTYPKNVLEFLTISNQSGEWGIDWVKYVALKPGSFVTNKLQNQADLNDDGFLTKDDNWTYGQLIKQLFTKPHSVESYLDEYFDRDKDSFIDEDEISHAVDILAIKAMTFSKKTFDYPIPKVDYTGDGYIDNDDITAVKDLIMSFELTEQQLDKILGDVWWIALPDFLLESVPREVNSYLDYIGDGNEDGMIDHDEQDIIESTFTMNATDQNYFFRSLDRNKDGELGWNELNLAMQISAKRGDYRDITPPPYPANTPLDKLLDKSGDFMIDSYEIESAVNLFANTDDQISVSDHLFKMVDENLNGKLEEEEIQRFKADYFYPREVDNRRNLDRASDIDKDGYVTLMEIGISAGFAGGSLVSTLDERIERKVMITEDQYSSADTESVLPIEGTRLAVINIDTSDSSLDPKAGKILRMFIETSFIQIGEVTLIERNDLMNLFDEMNFQMSGLVDESSAVEMGKMAGADVIGQGSISEYSGNFYLNLKLIKVESSEILASSMAITGSEMDFNTLAQDAVRMLY